MQITQLGRVLRVLRQGCLFLLRATILHVRDKPVHKLLLLRQPALEDVFLLEPLFADLYLHYQLLMFFGILDVQIRQLLLNIQMFFV